MKKNTILFLCSSVLFAFLFIMSDALRTKEPLTGPGMLEAMLTGIIVAAFFTIIVDRFGNKKP